MLLSAIMKSDPSRCKWFQRCFCLIQFSLVTGIPVNTLNELINYFQSLYQDPNVLFELKGVHINEKQCDMTDISDQQLSAVPLKADHADAEITTIHIPLLRCCATSFYSICFSIIKYCGCCNSKTLDGTLTMQTNFTKKKSMAITIHWLSTISQGHFKYMMQIFILPLIWRNKEYYAVHLLVANYCLIS